ncbi:MAG: hypothetical protein MHM6MM_007925 [Cercozoa sp. M6MM]
MSSAFARQARFHREDVAAETRRLRENTEQLEQHRRELEQQHRRELEQRETMFQEQLRAETERHREQVARLEAELAKARLGQGSVVNLVDDALAVDATNVLLDVKLRDQESDEERTQGSLQYHRCKIDVSDKEELGEKRRAVLSRLSDLRNRKHRATAPLRVDNNPPPDAHNPPAGN